MNPFYFQVRDYYDLYFKLNRIVPFAWHWPNWPGPLSNWPRRKRDTLGKDQKFKFRSCEWPHRLEYPTRVPYSAGYTASAWWSHWEPNTNGCPLIYYNKSSSRWYLWGIQSYVQPDNERRDDPLFMMNTGLRNKTGHRFRQMSWYTRLHNTAYYYWILDEIRDHIWELTSSHKR